MPETPVNEHVQADSRKRDVCPASSIERQGLAHAESQALGVQYRAEQQFWLCVAPSVRLHVSTHGGGDWRRWQNRLAIRHSCRRHSVPFTRHATKCAR